MNKIGYAMLFTCFVTGCFGSQVVEHANVGFDLSPNGQRIVFSSAGGDIYLLEVDTKKISRITETDRIELLPSFSPDGKTVVCAGSDDDGISFGLFTIDIATKATEQLTAPGDFSDMIPRFSPDGKQILFARAREYRPYSHGGMIWDKWDVCSIALNGESMTRLTQQEYPQLNRIVQHENGSIFYSADTFSNGKLKTQLYVLAPNSSPVPYVPHGNTINRSAEDIAFIDPVLSTDFAKLAYICDSRRPYYFDIHVTTFIPEKDHTEFHATKTQRINRYPDLGPDGETIFFLSGTKSNIGNRPIFSLWKIDPDGEQHEIASEDLLTDPEPWLPPSTNGK